MPDKSHPDRFRRALAALAIVSLVGLSLWAGLCARRRPPTPMDLHRRTPSQADVARAPGLSITEGPDLVATQGRRFIVWRTSAPADSLLTCGRRDAFENILAKDSRLVTEHRFELPERPFIELYRFHVRSTDAHHNVASAVCCPGRATGGALLADVTDRYPRLCAAVAAAGAMAWADYDADGDSDVVLAAPGDRGGGVRLLRREDAGFRDVTREACGDLRGSTVSWGDFDADGAVDLLACGRDLVLCRNSGPPRWAFDAVPSPAEPSAAGRFRFACFADLDGDGLPDILGVEESGALKALRNTGRPPGRLVAAEGLLDPASADGPAQAILCADLDGDGRSDVLVRTTRWALFRNVSGRLERAEDALPQPGFCAPAVALADYDGDGDLDLYVPPYEGAEGALLANDGAGRFHRVEAIGDLAGLRAHAACAVWADLTGTGRPDLIVGLAGGGVRVFFGDGSGSFMDGTDLCGLPREAGGGVTDVVAADFTGDSAPDLLIRRGSSGIRLLANCSEGAARGDYAGTFP